jgi:general secretion pathway protein D
MTSAPAHRRPLRLLALALWCLGLWGCAAQQAYREGQGLVAGGQIKQAIERFESASKLDPASAEYRLALRRARDQLLGEHLQRGDVAIERGQPDAAEQAYRQALALDGSSERALQGMRQADRQRRWDRWLREAEVAAGRKAWDDVRARVRPLLTENPRHARALELQRQADEAAAAAADRGGRDPALAAKYRRTLTIEFRDTPIKTVFEVISRSSGLNFVFDKDVKTDQRATLSLKDSTIEAAVGMLLASNQLDQRVLDANSILIYPNTAAKQREYQPLTVRSFYLAYADAKTVAATLKTLLKLRDPVIDEKLNLVIVRDSPDAVRMAEKVVALHDVPEAEVMLEVEILEVKRSRLMDLGVRWPEQLSLTPLPAVDGGTLTLADLRNLNSGTVGAQIGALSINARKTDADANLLANPRIRARNREKAKVHIGERVPNITTTSTSTGFVAESVNYVDVGLKLDVEPTIYPDDEVAIRVSLEVSNIVSQIQTKSGTLAYQIGTRTATTVLRLKDGENQVLAGLINDEDRRSANKVPGLGEVPLLGRLFGQQVDDNTKTEIVLSITPRVLRNLRRPDFSAQEFDSGTELNIGSGGSAPPAAAQTFTRSAGAAPATGPRPGATPATSPSTSPSTTPAGTSTAPAAPTEVPVAVSGGVAASIGGVAARWDAPAGARVGETFKVQLRVSSDMPVTALPLVMGVDPQVFQILSVTEGTFLRQGGALTDFTVEVDTAGQVKANGRRRVDTAGASAEAVAVTLELKVRARPSDGNGRIQLLTLAPLGVAGRALPNQAPAPLVLNIAP